MVGFIGLAGEGDLIMALVLQVRHRATCPSVWHRLSEASPQGDQMVVYGGANATRRLKKCPVGPVFHVLRFQDPVLQRLKSHWQVALGDDMSYKLSHIDMV